MTITINGIDQSVPSVEDYGAAVQDITALKAIGPSERFDQQHVYVEDETRPYWFDLDSAAAESLPAIVIPNDAPALGRWIRLPPEGGGVPAAHGSTHKGDGSDPEPVATPAISGDMSAADKTKLDGIATGADVTGDNPPQTHTHSNSEITDFDAGVTASTHAGRVDNPHVVTAAQALAIAIGAAAGGDLAGTYPNPTVQTAGGRIVKTTDDLVALVAAASAGDLFILEPGTHALSGVLAILVNNLEIWGPRGAVLTSNAAGASAITIAAGVSGTLLRGFSLTVVTGDKHGIEGLGTGVSNTRIFEMKFTKAGAVATGDFVRINGTTLAKGWVIQGCNFDGGGFQTNAVTLVTGGTFENILFLFSTVDAMTGVGFCIESGASTSTKILISKVIFTGGVDGIEIDSATTLLIASENVFTGQSSRGFDARISSFSDSAIVNNVFKSSGVEGIATSNSDRILMASNQFQDCVVGIKVIGAPDNQLIVNNLINNSTGIAIDVDGGTKTIIAKNTIIGGTKGIVVAGGSDIVIVSNTIRTLTNSAIAFCIEYVGGTRGVIAGNFCDGAFSAAAIKSTVPGVVIRDNSIDSGENGIFVDLSATAGAEGPVVESNTIRSTREAGIKILGQATHIDGFTCSRNKVFDACLSGGVASINISLADKGDVDTNRMKDGLQDGLRLVDVDKTRYLGNRIDDHAVAGKFAIIEDAGCDDNEYSHTFSRGNTGNYSFSGTNRVEVFNNPVS